MRKSDQVLIALRSKVESENEGWGTVYLDNARPNGMSDRAFRSCLAKLSKENCYRPVDGFAFGEVKILRSADLLPSVSL